MAGLDGIGGGLNPLLHTNHDQSNDVNVFQREPIQTRLQNISDDSMAETLESMSLVMSSRLRQWDKKGDAKTSRSSMQNQIIGWVPKIEGGLIVDLISQFPNLGMGQQDPLDTLVQAGVETGAMVLLLASILNSPHMENSRRKKLERALERLLEKEGITIDMLGVLELENCTQDDLYQIKQLYQRSKRQEEGGKDLLEFYNEICDWPEREKRIVVLIRALGLDLGIEGDRQQLGRILQSIKDLKRLLIFLGVEEHALFVAASLDMSGETILRESLYLLSQYWIYPEWLEERVGQIGIPPDQSGLYVRKMLELLRFVPEMCFNDEDHYAQLLDAFEKLQDKLADAEE